jgi:hypothetical protein
VTVTPVQSSNLAALGWEPLEPVQWHGGSRLGTLEVHFRSRQPAAALARYRVAPVPEAIYDLVRTADSIGGAYNTLVRAGTRWKATRLPDVPPAEETA